MDAIIGDSNFTGPNQPALNARGTCRSLTLGAGTKGSTLTLSKPLTVSGNVTIGPAGTLNHSGRVTLTLSGDWSNSGSYTGSNKRATITFAGAAPSILGTSVTEFRRLSVNAGTRLSLRANISVVNQLTVSGTLEPEETPVPRTISGSGRMTVNSGGILKVVAPTVAGNYQLPNVTLNAGSTVDYASTTINQTVGSAWSYSTLRLSGGTTKSLAANLPALNSATATAGNLILAAGTLDLGSFTANRGAGVTGGSLTIADGARLIVGGANNFPANYATPTIAGTSTVLYNGGNQTVAPQLYGNLAFSGAGGAANKTLPAGTITVAGNLTISRGASPTVTVTAGGPVTVRGHVSLEAATSFQGGSFAHVLGGSLLNDGTFVGGTGFTTFTGDGATVSGTGTNLFNDLTFSGAGVQAAANTSLTVNGNLATTGAGGFTHVSGGTSTLTLAGTSKTIAGNNLVLHHVTVPGTVGTTASFTINGSLRVDGSFTATAGRLTLGGTSEALLGAGPLALNALFIPGSLTTVRDFRLTSDLSVTGSFAATAGTATFAGSTTFSGTADLSTVVLNGNQLRLSTGSRLGVAGAFTVTAGTVDTATGVPNTVVYNGAGAQSVWAGSYHHLVLAGQNTKTAAGAIIARGDLTITAAGTFAAGPFTHRVAGDWINQGTFVGSGSGIVLDGSQDTTVQGSTTFALLQVAKASAANIVELGASVQAATVQMTQGTLLTGTNTITISSDRLGPGHILGRIERIHSFQPGIPYAFEGPDNTVTFTSLGVVTNVTVVAASSPVRDFPFGGAINREYTLSVGASGAYDATLRLHYEDRELGGAREPSSQIWRFQAPWTVVGRTGGDPAANWIEQGGVSDLSGRWTISDDLNVVRWSGAINGAWDNPGNWAVIEGSPQAPPSTNDIVELGAGPFANQPTVSTPVRIRSLSFGSAQAVNLLLAPGGSLELAGNGGDIAGTWTQPVTHTIQVGDQRIVTGGILQMSDGLPGHAINLQIGSGTVEIGGDMFQSGDASVVFSGSGSLRLGAGFFRTGGTFAAGTGTVVYAGPGPQQVAGGFSYHHLAFDKPSGTATLTAAAAVTGDLTVTNIGTVRLAADLAVAGRLTAYSGSRLEGGTASIRVGGDWESQASAFVPDLGTVVMNGASDQSVRAGAFHNLSVEKPSGKASLGSAVSLGGNLNIISGSLDLGPFTANRSALGGELTMGAGTSLGIGTGSAFPQSFALRTIADNSTVVYNGTSAQVITENSYGNLLLVNGGPSVKTLAGNTTVRGDLIIETNAALGGGSVALAVQGNWDNRGIFVPATSSVTLAGVGKGLLGTNAFNVLTVTGSYASTAFLQVASRLTLSGSLDTGAALNQFSGDVTVTGSLGSSGTIRFTGTAPQVLALNAGFASSGTVEFNGTVAPTLLGTAAPGFANLLINNTGGVAPPVGWTVGGDFTVSAGARFAGGPHVHRFLGSFLDDGAVSSGGTLEFAPTAPAVIRINGTLFQSTGLVDFAGSAPLTLQGGPLSLQSVSVRNSAPAGVTPPSAWTVSGDVSVGAGALLRGATFSHTVLGNWFNAGVFDGQGSTVVFNGLSDIGGIGSTVFNHVQIPGTAAAVDDFNVAGDFLVNGTFDGSGATVIFVGPAAAQFGGTSSPLIFDSLTVAKDAATLRLAVALDGLTALTVSSGALDAGTFAVLQDPVGGVLAVGSGALLRLGGTTTLPAFTAYAFDPAGTVEYYGNGNQTIAAVDYGSLASSGTGARVLPATGTIGITGGFQPGANAYTITGSTLSFKGAGSQVIPAFNYFNLASEGAGLRQLSPTGVVGVAAGFSPGTNPYTTLNSTVNFNGGPQTVPALAYHNLQLAGTGTKTLGGAISVQGDLQLLTGSLANAGFIATVRGSLLNQTTVTGTGGIRLQGGPAVHRLAGSGGYDHLELDDPAGAILETADLPVRQSLLLTTGILSAGTYRVLLGSTGNVNRTAGHIAGQLQKPIPTGASTRTFEVGDTTSYTPVTVAFGNVTTAGSLTAQAIVGDAPQLATSGLVATRSVNRYWRLAGTGVAFNNYTATLQFVPSDLDPGTDPGTLYVAVRGPVSWSQPQALNRTPTTIQAGGITTFGDLAAGQSALGGSFTGVTVLPDGNPQLNFTGNPGQVYRVEATTSLVHPIAWVTVSTNTAAADGRFQFVDLLGTNFAARFYRSATP